MHNDNDKNLVIIDQAAMLELLAMLERKVFEFQAFHNAREAELMQAIAKQTAKQIGDQLPLPVQTQVATYYQEPVATQYHQFAPETQHLLTRIVDQLIPFFPSLYQIRPYVDQLTWKKLLLFLIVLVIAANTVFGTTLTNTLPILRPAIDWLHIKSLDPTPTTAKPEQCNGTNNTTPAPSQTPAPIQGN